ncbi:hypothetical protein OEZ86_012011 [Tetradesmus obliquus]|nr:hypothetical protein OEZ86_012011 [Tetradesmus obliquus]
MSFFPGGKGANQAAAAAQLSYPTYFLGKVGIDSYAAPLRAALAGAGVRLDHLQGSPGPTGTAVILLQSSGENSIIIVGGANQDEKAWNLSKQEQQLIAGAGAVLLQREIPEAANIQVAKPAVKAPQVVDTTGAGDCFTAAFMVGLLEGASTAAAMRLAAAAAAICVSRPGAQPSMPSRAQLDSFLATLA